jgi:hypothetical protein
MRFCENCGARIERTPACRKCGAVLIPGVIFCGNCGESVSPPATGEAAVPPTEPVPPSSKVKTEEKPGPEPVVEKVTEAPAEEAVVKPPAPQTPVIGRTPTCRKCGTALAPGVIFCGNCGESISQPASSQVAAPPAGKAPVKESPVAAKAPETGPKKPMSPATMIIAGIVVLALLAAAVFFVVLPMLSGSGTAAAGQPVSPAGTNSGTQPANGAASQAGTASLVAGPTDVPPANRALIIDVEKNAISHDIIVTFQGGGGQYGVRELAVTLTRSDGTVETQSLGHLERGSSITLKGSEKTDRVEVTANFYNGETYKVVDKVFEYKKRIGSS